MKKISLFLSLSLMVFGLNAQNILGCTDPQANNYDISATINDGSCTYNPTIYKPDFRFILPDEVEETSGLFFSPRVTGLITTVVASPFSIN